FLVRPDNALALAESAMSVQPATVGADTAAFYREHPDLQTMIRQFATARFTPHHPGWDAMEAAIEDEVEQALYDRKTPARAVAAVDSALVRFRGAGADAGWELVTYRETPLEPPLRREVLEIAALESVDLERLLRLDAALGERYAAAVLELIAAEGLEPGAVGAIGCHGQTVRHLPRRGRGPAAAGETLTLQIGSAPILAERTGITVVSDFRRRDAAAGGEG